MLSYIAKPFERVTMDITEPLPKTNCGNRYILIVVDIFTNNVKAYAVTDLNARTTAKVFLNEIV